MAAEATVRKPFRCTSPGSAAAPKLTAPHSAAAVGLHSGTAQRGWRGNHRRCCAARPARKRRPESNAASTISFRRPRDGLRFGPALALHNPSCLDTSSRGARAPLIGCLRAQRQNWAAIHPGLFFCFRPVRKESSALRQITPAVHTESLITIPAIGGRGTKNTGCVHPVHARRPVHSIYSISSFKK